MRCFSGHDCMQEMCYLYCLYSLSMMSVTIWHQAALYTLYRQFNFPLKGANKNCDQTTLPSDLQPHTKPC